MENFENLYNLESLNFAGNQIEKVESDTFENLGAVDKINLGRNRIKSINADLFEVMIFLNTVILESNQCIDENFVGEKGILAIAARINNRCKFQDAAKEVKCFSISNGCTDWTTGACCDMSRGTAIGSPNTIISGAQNTEMLRMHFSGNKQIQFLPVSVAIKFPNIIHYWARACSIQKISKLNFVGLEMMSNLWLASNEIETIMSDTFEGLKALQNIGLG